MLHWRDGRDGKEWRGRFVRTARPVEVVGNEPQQRLLHHDADVALPTLPILQFDGRATLTRVIVAIALPVAQAVASLTAFAHPKTVAPTEARNVFRSVRHRQQGDVGTFAEVAGCDGRVMRDDNRSPAVAFEWAHGIRERPDVQVNHVWSRSRDVTAYTSLANLCLTLVGVRQLCEERRSRSEPCFGIEPSTCSGTDSPTESDVQARRVQPGAVGGGPAAAGAGPGEGIPAGHAHEA
jgi:hypothetical protein